MGIVDPSEPVARSRDEGAAHAQTAKHEETRTARSSFTVKTLAFGALAVNGRSQRFCESLASECVVETEHPSQSPGIDFDR
jgi:hypothetical protein